MKDLKNLLPVLALSVDVVAEGIEHVPSIGAAPWLPDTHRVQPTW